MRNFGCDKRNSNDLFQSGWGGKRQCAGRKRTCRKKIAFNRRINEDVLSILKSYSESYEITDTEAIERAILVLNNIDKINGGKFMKIAIPSKDGKLCVHFGNCEDFTFVDVDAEKKEILGKEIKVPQEGISCQSASWVAEQGANIVLAGGMGGRPLTIFAQNGVGVVAGCPELPIEELISSYLERSLKIGENSCESGHHCHGHSGQGEHHCHGHHHGNH